MILNNLSSFRIIFSGADWLRAERVGYCRENVPQSWAPQSSALIGPAPALLLQVLNKNYLRMGKEENLGTSIYIMHILYSSFISHAKGCVTLEL